MLISKCDKLKELGITTANSYPMNSDFLWRGYLDGSGCPFLFDYSAKFPNDN